MQDEEDYEGPVGNDGKPKSGRLTIREAAFCAIYVAQAPFFNGTKAANEAGYSSGKDQAHKLLKREYVQEEIKRLREETAIRNNIKLDDIINQYAKKAFFDIREAYDEEGNLHEVKNFSDRVAANIIGIDVEELWEGSREEKHQIGVLKKIKVSDQTIVALDRLRECLGWKEKEKKVKRDAEGKIIETEETENGPIEDKVIFEDHSGKVDVTV